MFMRTTAHADTALPWGDRPRHARRSRIGNIRLDAAAVARFDRLLHDIHPGARHVDADRIATLARWLQELPVERARAVLDERLARIEQLRAMLDDADWDRREAPCQRVRKLLAYLEHDHDLIPDPVPLLGLLDDVILLELAWPAVATEAEDYADFCDYRGMANPAGDGPQRREAWIRDRLQALALYQHQERVNSSHYVDGGHPDRPFRVG
ncbi:MAG TPA: YkvA family protein [Thermomonas sp.]|nr:YkvA family protein [Thermomonas sp.]